MYIDKTPEGDIQARVLFCYGSVEFNHFAGEKPVVSGKVLLRDRRQENAFIPVSYTHLDVYKRQVMRFVRYSQRPSIPELWYFEMMRYIIYDT